MSDPLLGDAHTAAVGVLGHWKRHHLLRFFYPIALLLNCRCLWHGLTPRRQKTDMSQMFGRSDGIQELFVNWKAWTSSVHRGVHFKVFEMPVGERGREKSHDQEAEEQRQKEAGLGDE